MNCLVEAQPRRYGPGKWCSEAQNLLFPMPYLPLACQISQPLCCRRCMHSGDHQPRAVQVPGGQQ